MDIIERLTTSGWLMSMLVFLLATVVMAPVQLGDRINAAAMVGTWLGTVLTGIGLIALFAQLQSVVADFRKSRRALLVRSAGDWITLIPKKDTPERGVMEAVAPGFLGWVQNAYLKDTSIVSTQAVRTGAGTSGWSNLFAHCGIKADDLIKFGGPDAKVYPAVTGSIGTGAPRLADLKFEDGRIFYGFTQNEFAAFLVIGGWSISDYSITGCSTSTKFYGNLQLADDSPFSQVARFDAHDGCRIISQDKERYINNVPIRRCIDYALSVIPTQYAPGCRNFIILADVAPSDDRDNEYRAWEEKPRATQLNTIRYTKEQLLSISGDEMLKYSVQTSADTVYLTTSIKTLFATTNIPIDKARALLQIAHAISSLEPWPLLPVLPAYFSKAFIPLLKPFVGTHEQTISVLQDKMVKAQLSPLDGWDTIHQQAAALSQIGDIKIEFFSESCNTCRWYFKAMVLVFEALHVRIRDVRVELAVRAVRTYLASIVVNKDFDEDTLRELLRDGTVESVPEWAVTVYATFLWGWMNDYVQMDFDFRGRFRRRVYLC